MSHGRLPSTKIKKKKKDFYPLRRCQDCPQKWKGTEMAKHGKILIETDKVISCKSTCLYLKGV